MRRPLALNFLSLAFLFGVLPFAWAETSFVDLSKAANMGPAQSFDEVVPGGEDLKEKEGIANIPQGPQTFRGIPFELLDSLKNQGRSFVVLKGKRKGSFPEAIALNASHLKADMLYFLHSCKWGGTASNITVAEYDILYDDGQVVVVPLRVGLELTNFSGSDDTPASYLAWWHKYKNTDMGINLFPWKNPRPDVPIQTILFKSMNKMPVPILFAITASDKEMPVSKTSPKPEKTFQTDTTSWIPLETSRTSPAGTAIDMSFLLDAPAGKHGKVKAAGDQLVFEDGTPARFWGTNLPEGWDRWSAEEMGEIAARLAINGCNLVSIQSTQSPLALTTLLEKLKGKGIYLVVKGRVEAQPSPIPLTTPIPEITNDPAVISSELAAQLLVPETDSHPSIEPSGSFDDVPMIAHPEANSLASLISKRVFGKPFLAQWGMDWPNEYIAELPLLWSAYASFEGWPGSLSGIFNVEEPDGAMAIGDGINDKPGLFVQWPTAALAYLRGDLKEGRIYLLGKDNSSLISLAHRSGIQGEGGKVKTDIAGKLKAKISEKNHSFISDSEQIHWQGNVGVVQISTTRFQAAVGFIGHRKLKSPVWEVESPNFFASLSLISLNGTNLWASNHMLLAGETRMENTGQVYNLAKTKLVSTGKAPILVEPLQAKVTLFRYKKNSQLKVRALDANGQILKVKVPFKWVGNNLSVSWVPSAFYLEIFQLP